MKQYISIKEWAEDDRPREKLLAKGVASLSDAELIAILIRSGTRKESAVDLAKKILKKAENNLNNLAKMNVNQLSSMNGIGNAKAISIVAAMELGKRRKLAEVIKKESISNSQDVFHIFHSILCDLPYEEFWILLLNQSNKIINKIKISQGGISGTITDIRLIMEAALVNKATSLIICHNHPSGNKKPSESDITITEKIKNASNFLDIRLLDHIIIAENDYFSFADEGKI